MVKEFEKQDIKSQLLLAKEVESSKDRISEDISLNTPMQIKLKAINKSNNCWRAILESM